MKLQDISNQALSCSQTSQQGKITERCQKEAAPGQSETKSEKLLVNVPALIYQFLLRLDGSLTFMFLSANCGEFFEMEGGGRELDTEALVSMIHPDDLEDFYDSIAEAADTLQPWRWVGRYILPSGRTKWIQWDAQPTLQANGNIFWNGLLVDVTSQQQLNAEVKRLSFLLGLTERLQSTSDLYEIAQFALNYFVQATNCAFGDVKVISGIEENCQACPLTNYISAEFVAVYGEPAVDEMKAFLLKSIPKGQGVLWEVVETGQPLFIKDYASHPNAIPALRHPGIGQIGIFPIPATDGTVMGVLTLESRKFERIQDAPQQDLLLAACCILGARIERAKDRERLRQTNAELECSSEQLRQQAQQLEQTLYELQQAQAQLVHSEKMSSLGQLVAGVAHEINNPVSFIHGNLSHAREYFKDLLYLLEVYGEHYPQPASGVQAAMEDIDLDFLSEDLPKLLDSMQVGAERIRDIVRSLRNFSRLEEAEMKPVDIHEGIDSTLMMLGSRLRSQPGRPEIQVIKEYDNLPPVECYAGQLNQVFLNIISNAIDALEEGMGDGEWGMGNGRTGLHPIPTIRICTEVLEGSRIAIEIVDNGPGIPESVLPRLFDPFFTTKPVGKGTGLGLSISYQIVTEKHGGKLQCISAPGQGTKFVIEIPRQQLELRA